MCDICFGGKYHLPGCPRAKSSFPETFVCSNCGEKFDYDYNRHFTNRKGEIFCAECAEERDDEYVRE